MDKNWYLKGLENVDKIKQQQIGGIRRFYLKRGESADVIFLDDEAFIIREHCIWVEDDFGNHRAVYFTCCRDVEDKCPLCEAGNKPYNIGYFTVIDERTYNDKNGNAIKRGKVLYGGKVTILEKLKNKKKIRGSFVNRRAVIFRSDSPNSPTSGDDIEFMEQVETKEVPFDYVKELEPLSYDKLLAEYKNLKLSSKVVVKKADSGIAVEGGIAEGEDIDF